MGAGLNKAAYAVADRLRLDHAPARLYAYMAVIALDDDPSPAYWGGRDELVRALGAPAGSAGYRAVSRAVGALLDKRAVQLTPSAPGRNARYALLDERSQPLAPLPNGGRSPSPNATTEDGQRLPNGGRSASERRTVSVRTEDGQRRPEEERNEKEEGEPPSEYCERHPGGTDRPCASCGKARVAARDWTPAKPRGWKCSLDGHKLTVDGSCAVCEYRGGQT